MNYLYITTPNNQVKATTTSTNYTSSYLPKQLPLLLLLIIYNLLFFPCLCLTTTNNTNNNKTMSVSIQNSQGYYYQKYCQLTFSIISNIYIRPSQQSPTLKQRFWIQFLSESSLKFNKQYQSPYIHLNDSRIMKSYTNNNCGFQTSDNFYCLQIIYSQKLKKYSQVIMKVNQTYDMFRFTLKNVVCPNYVEDFYKKQYMVKISIVKTNNGNIDDGSDNSQLLAGNYAVNWKYQLQFPYVRSVDMLLLKQQSTINNDNNNNNIVQHRIIGCGMPLKFGFVISDGKLANTWSKIIISIVGNNTKNNGYQFTNNNASNQQYTCGIHSRPQQISLYGQQYRNVTCKLQSSSSSSSSSSPNNNNYILTIVNPNITTTINNNNNNNTDPYQINNYYNMYQYPIKQQQSLLLPQQYYITTPSINILDKQQKIKLQIQIAIIGMIRNISTNQIQQVVYYHNNNNKMQIISINQSQYSMIYIDDRYYQQKGYLQQCIKQRQQYQQQQSIQQQQLIDYQQIINTLRNKINTPFFTIFLTIFMLLLIILIRFKAITNKMYKIQYYIYFLWVILDLPLKLLMYILVQFNGNNNDNGQQQSSKSLNYIIKTILVFQCLFSLFGCFIGGYFYYVIKIKNIEIDKNSCSKKNYKQNKQQYKQQSKSKSKSVSWKKIAAIFALLVYNYKFYPIFLSKVAVKPIINQNNNDNNNRLHRIKNNHIFYKHCQHLTIEFIIGIISIVGMLSISQTFQTITIVNIQDIYFTKNISKIIICYILCAFQFVMCYLMAVMSRNVYHMLKIQEIKEKVRRSLSASQQVEIKDRRQERDFPDEQIAQ